AWANNQLLGVVGLGPRTNASSYPDEDLDLLMATADSVAQLLLAEAQQARGREQLFDLVTNLQQDELRLRAGAHDLIAAMESQLDRKFERTVELCSQHLSDFNSLGQSSLAAELLVEGANHIERGKALREVLLQAIESLRPAGSQPSAAQAVPRE